MFYREAKRLSVRHYHTDKSLVPSPYKYMQFLIHWMPGRVFCLLALVSLYHWPQTWLNTSHSRLPSPYYKKSVDPWRCNFVMDHQKNVIKQYLWRSQNSSCIERHRLYLVMFSAKLSQITKAVMIYNRHKIVQAHPSQPRPIIYDENKHHGLNCHVTHKWHSH